jgi:hypothetical protein
MFFLLFLLDVRIRFSDQWIRMCVREAQKHKDPKDPDPDLELDL